MRIFGTFFNALIFLGFIASFTNILIKRVNDFGITLSYSQIQVIVVHLLFIIAGLAIHFGYKKATNRLKNYDETILDAPIETTGLSKRKINISFLLASFFFISIGGLLTLVNINSGFGGESYLIAAVFIINGVLSLVVGLK